jgi:CRP-like cAMP-binding protein
MPPSHNPLIRYLAAVAPLTPAAIADLDAAIRHEQHPKNTELLRIGQYAHSMYYIQKGLARAYYLHAGREVTDYFALEGQFIGAVPSLFTGQPSQKAIHLIEAAELYAFSALDFEACCAAHHCVEHVARRIMAMGLVQEQARIEAIRFHSAAQRYADLEVQFPGISNRSPLKYIASYLNTSQVSISRIRSGVQ